MNSSRRTVAVASGTAEAFAVQSVKLACNAAPGLSEDARHVHVGLAASPWLAAVMVVLAGASSIQLHCRLRTLASIAAAACSAASLALR